MIEIDSNERYEVLTEEQGMLVLALSTRHGGQHELPNIVKTIATVNKISIDYHIIAANVKIFAIPIVSKILDLTYSKVMFIRKY